MNRVRLRARGVRSQEADLREHAPTLLAIELGALEGNVEITFETIDASQFLI